MNSEVTVVEVRRGWTKGGTIEEGAFGPPLWSAEFSTLEGRQTRRERAGLRGEKRVGVEGVEAVAAAARCWLSAGDGWRGATS